MPSYLLPFSVPERNIYILTPKGEVSQDLDTSQFHASGLGIGKCKPPKWRPGNLALQKADEQVLPLYKWAY